MSTIAALLQAKQPLFDHALYQLEALTGRPGTDARLMGEITTAIHTRTTTLGLTPDCTARQLYTALIERVQADDARLARAIGGGRPDAVAELLPLIVATVTKLDLPRRGFFLKEATAAAMLRRTPPRAIMARLGYTQIEKLLQAEDLAELFLALRFAESPSWLNRFNAQYARLHPSDFEARDLRIISFDVDKWGDIAAPFIAKKLHNITNSKEMGAIGLMPMNIARMPGLTLKVLPLLIHYHNEIRLYSAFFKLLRSKANFGRIVAATLIADPAHLRLIDGPRIHWRVIQRYFGKLPHEQHPEILEPHLQPEDLHWRKAEAVLYELDPKLDFWRDLDYVAARIGAEAVSFNLMDVALSYSNGLSFSDRYLYHFREALWNEIFARYFGQAVLERQLLEKLDNEVIKPEELEIKV